MRQFSLLFAFAMAFVGLQAQSDSTQLSFQRFMAQVSTNHPLTMQANLRNDIAEAELLGGRAGFEPRIDAGISQKYFDDKTYYDYQAVGLTVPTWFGIELNGGYQINNGVFLNPEANVPSAGLWDAGLSVNLTRGLIFDERRATLQQAKLFQDAALFQQQQMLNEVFKNAAKAYWNWFKSHYVLEIRRDAERLALVRYEGTLETARLGDIRYLDTLEAGIQLQNRRIALIEAELINFQAKQDLSVFLWDQGIIPLEISPLTTPESADDLNALLPENVSAHQQFLANHPKLGETDIKIQQSEIDVRLNEQMIRPDLKLKYNALNGGTGSNLDAFQERYTLNNYTWGADFKLPIFLRKERAKLQKSRVKLMTNELDFANIGQQIQAKYANALAELEATASLYEQTSVNVERYRLLLNGENTLFLNGESSLFLVNRREVSYINSRVKQIELLSKNQFASVNLNYSLGKLHEDY